MWAVGLGALAAIGAGLVVADAQPYGCWSIRDDVERLACFDMALGPPNPGGGSASFTAPATAHQSGRDASGRDPAPGPGTVPAR